MAGAVLAFAGGCAKATAPTSDDAERGPLAPRAVAWLTAFDRQLALAAPACTYRSNDDGSLSWGASYLLLALLDAWGASRDVKYLDRFIEEADRIVAWSDRPRGVADWVGRVDEGWSSTRYTTGNVRARWVVLDGVIAEPLAAFGAEARSNPGLPDHVKRAGRRYVEVARAVTQAWEAQWQEVDGSGAYVMAAGFPSDVGDTVPTHLPLNHSAAAGLVHYELWRATGERPHLDKAVRIGRRIRSHLVPRGDGWTWTYWGRESYGRFGTSPEDVSHGALEVRLLARLGREQQLLSDADRRRLAQTLVALKHPAGGFFRDVNGSSEDLMVQDPKCGTSYPRTHSDAAPLWLVLRDSALSREIAAFVDARIDSAGWEDPVRLAGLSALARYWPRGPLAP